MPQDAMQVIGKIERTLLEANKPMSISMLAKKTKLHYTTVKRYVMLLESVKKMPTIETIGGEGITLVRLERDLAKLREEEIKQIIKQHFPDMDKEEKLLIRLLEKGAVSKEKAVKMRITEFIENLIRLERVKKTKNGKIYLTNIGYGIACGAKKIYSD
jgi:DNA-binding transcriptional regulator YhcF (GntR family)